jgi:hypothetical protein
MLSGAQTMDLDQYFRVTLQLLFGEVGQYETKHPSNEINAFLSMVTGRRTQNNFSQDSSV